MEKSEQLDKLAAALCKVQLQLKSVEKNKENPFFKSTYADLAGIWDAVRKVLGDAGLTISQSTSFHDGHFFLKTYLLHISGQFLTGEYLIKPVKEDPQGFASAVTYARRYALSSILGVTTENEDDDGEHAMARHEAKAQTKPAEKSAQPSGDVLKCSFTPAAYAIKRGEKNGKPWTKHSVKDDSDIWFSSFDDNVGDTLKRATDQKQQITVEYKNAGQYGNTIVTADFQLEEVPF